jgi:hypothetical protein
MGFSFSMFGEPVKTIALHIGFALLAWFFIQRLLAIRSGKTTGIILLFLLVVLPVTNLPRIASIEKWDAFRTLGVTTVCIVILFFHTIRTVRFRPLRMLLTLLLWTAIAGGSYYTVNERMFKLYAAEYRLVYDAFAAAIHQRPDAIDIIRPAWYSHTFDTHADEYGLPATCQPWAVEGLFNLVAAREDGNGDTAFQAEHITGVLRYKVTILDPDEARPREGSLVINLKELIEARQ